MIDWAKRANRSGLDLNVEAQTRSLLRTSAQGSHASRHARVCAGHGPSAAFDVSPVRGCASRRAQGAGILLPRSVLRDGLCPVDRARVVARYRSQLARPIGAPVPHWLSLQDYCAQHPGQRECDTTLADVRRLRTASDWYRQAVVRGGAVGRSSSASRSTSSAVRLFGVPGARPPRFSPGCDPLGMATSPYCCKTRRVLN